MTRPQVAARHFRVAVVALALIGFVSVLVSSVTSMALEPLSEAFGVSMTSIVWVTTAFLLAAGLALPAAGWAVDRFGGFVVLLAGLVVFAAGSLGSGWAETFESLIAARAVQGLGGGILEPASLALVAQITQRERIGAVMGLMSIVIYLAPALGPVVGAALLSGSGWRSVFLFAVPPVVLAGALLAVSLRQRRTTGHAPGDRSTRSSTGTRTLDVIGLALLGVSFTAMMLAIARLSGDDPWQSVTAGALGIGTLAAYTWRSVRVASPVIDPRLFRDRRFSGAVAIMGLGGVVLFSVLTVVPLISVRLWGTDGLAHAQPLAAFGLGMLVAMGVTGPLSDRVGSRRIVTVAAMCASVSLAALAASVHLMSPPLTMGALALFAAGLGYGAVSAPTFASLYRILPTDLAGRGTTAALIVVQIGAGLGATGIGAVLDGLGGRAFTLVPAVVAALMAVVAILANATLPARAEASRPPRHAGDSQHP